MLAVLKLGNSISSNLTKNGGGGGGGGGGEGGQGGKKFVAKGKIELNISWPSKFFEKNFRAPLINLSVPFKA